MLVLARQVGDGITFPELDIQVEVLKILGNRVQLGVHASREIAVLRSELIDDPTMRAASPLVDSARAVSLRNKIRDASVQLALARAQLERGDVDAAEGTLIAMRHRDTLKSVAAMHVSEPHVAYHTTIPQSMIQGSEGLAC